MKKICGLILLVACARQIYAQETLPEDYAVGNPSFTEYYVSPQGDDDNSGTSTDQAFRTLTQAYGQIPKSQTLNQAIRINLAAGSYAEADLPNFWEDITGTSAAPVVIRASSGPGTAILQGDINALNLNYVYFIDLNIVPVPAGDAFHCELCTYVLLKRVTLNGGDISGGAHETLKVNQSRYFYVEDSDIAGADDNAVDYVAVQYGHIIRTAIHRANDWCVYTKGGSAQITLAGNIIYDCGVGGFTAGQGSGFEFMQSPWLHYEAYDIKFVNNIVRDTEGAGIGVNGGYNITLAFNTLYQVGSRSHLIEVYRGRRGCDGNAATCNLYATNGGWGGNVAEDQVIPNKNVFIYNNVVYNPSSFTPGTQHFDVHPPQSTVAGFQNITFPALADDNLQIKGNLIWSGAADQPLGIEGGDSCTNSNPTCNEAQLRADNTINSVEPQLAAPTTGDFRPTEGSNVLSATGYTLPSFAGGDTPTPPSVPAGNLTNVVNEDRGGTARAGNPPGAYASATSSLGSTGPNGDSGDDDDNGVSGSAPTISSVTAQVKKNKKNKKKVSVQISAAVSDTDGDLATVRATVQSTKGGPTKTITLRGNGTYTGKAGMKKSKTFNVTITATDAASHSTTSEAVARR